MPPRNSSRGAHTSVKALKPSAGKMANVDASTPPPPVSVQPTPRATRISPRKRELPANMPAVQISDLAPSPVPSCPLSFGTINVDDDVDVDSEEVDMSLKKQRPAVCRVVLPAEGDNHPAPHISFGTMDTLVEEGEVAVQDDDTVLEVTPHTLSKLLGSKCRSTVKASKVSLSVRDRRQANPAKW
ncbi:hypothetical protein BDN71DRAFT_1453196 [Pleurotus eryngii]|uniref:Uncharacterized protein n=1 Tax=Pleurotus eryngii TaxID=5323 RepID=A0A9P6D3L1_PLEER|nr:hypothetical protein BDN71DRAFT_1453196 [Pleurotus eryngii]